MHTFRHTYSTLLRSIGIDIKVQQELLRHANVQTTLDAYTQAVSSAKRAAHGKVVRMVLEAPKTQEGPPFGDPSRMGVNGSL